MLLGGDSLDHQQGADHQDDGDDHADHNVLHQTGDDEADEGHGSHGDAIGDLGGHVVQVEAVGTGGSHDGGVGDGGQVVAAHTASAGGSQADGQQGGLIIPVKHGADQGDHDADGAPGGTGGEANEAGHDEDDGGQELGQGAGVGHDAANELADLQTIENALPKLEKDLRGKKIEPAYMEAVKQAKTILEAGETIDKATREGRFDKDSVYDLHLMSAKPFIYVFNVDDNELANKELQAKLAASVAPAPAVFLNAQFESDLTDLDEADAREMLEDAGLSESGLDQLARVGFDILGLQTFLTAGVKEVRAWQIHKGWTAPQAAGVIHTDFERGFIKADIVSYDDFVAAEGSMVKIKEEGKLRQEGRDYVMQDGDIVEFKFNVSK